jgi:8-oxo-dGTP diphosphatase
MDRRLNPHVSVDCVVFACDFQHLKVLLVKRKVDIDEQEGRLPALKLPGSLVYDDEFLSTSAQRILKELTGLSDLFLEQFSVFDSPDRVGESDRDWLEHTSGLPINRVISVGYLAMVKYNETSEKRRLKAGASWVNINEVDLLPFDHNKILQKAIDSLRNRLQYEPVGIELLPRKFTIRQLQSLYEIILGTTIDDRNFRKKLATLKYFVPLEEKQEKVAHKPARLYRFDKEIYDRIAKENMAFNL